MQKSFNQLDENEDQDPEVRFFFNPDQLGVCSFAVSFTNRESCDEASRKMFDNLTIEKAEGAIKSVVESAQEETEIELTFTGADL